MFKTHILQSYGIHYTPDLASVLLIVQFRNNLTLMNEGLFVSPFFGLVVTNSIFI